MLKRTMLVLILGLAILWPTPSWPSAAGCPGDFTGLRPRGYEQLTVSTTAVGFASIPAQGSDLAVVMIEDAALRYRDDGTNPTSTVGTLRQANTELVVCGNAQDRIKFIRSGGTDAKLSINYYGR